MGITQFQNVSQHSCYISVPIVNAAVTMTTQLNMICKLWTNGERLKGSLASSIEKKNTVHANSQFKMAHIVVIVFPGQVQLNIQTWQPSQTPKPMESLQLVLNLMLICLSLYTAGTARVWHRGETKLMGTIWYRSGVHENPFCDETHYCFTSQTFSTSSWWREVNEHHPETDPNHATCLWALQQGSSPPAT